jgi:hypothetical protein
MRRMKEVPSLLEELVDLVKACFPELQYPGLFYSTDEETNIIITDQEKYEAALDWSSKYRKGTLRVDVAGGVVCANPERP